MFEDKTFESIMASMMSRIPSNFDKSKGSIIYDALAPAAVELINAYISMNAVINETFADTASIDYLQRRVVERGMTRIMATKAILKGEFTPSSLDILIGTRFNCDKLNYKITEKISSGVYKLECETAGSEGNEHTGRLIPIDYVSGLETATLTEVLVPARDNETADELRQRYFDSLSNQSYGGNIADYKQHTLAVTGVGEVKVTPVWDGGGTVKLTILDTEFETPTQTLIDLVQNTMDPVGHSGEGYGVAPIGHTVTVVGASSVTVNIVTTISYETGWSWESAGEYIKQAVDDYFEELSRSWQNEDALVVRISILESKILAAQGVLDITGTTLNGSASNLQLTASQIPKRGTINGNE